MGACTCKAAPGGAQPQPLFRDKLAHGSADLAHDDDMNIKQPSALAYVGDDSEGHSTLPSETDLNDGAVVDSATAPDEQVAKDNCSHVPIKASTTSCMKGLFRPWCCS